MSVRKYIPRMFHRRLALLAAAMAIVFLVLGSQLVRLSIVHGAEKRAAAERALQTSTVLPTWRGRILDRAGRVLAVEEPGYSVAVDYDVITGDWITAASRRDAQDALGKSVWVSMTPEAQAAEAANRRAPFDARRERLFAMLCDYGDLSRIELDEVLESIRARVEELAAHVHKNQRLEEMKQLGIEPIGAGDDAGGDDADDEGWADLLFERSGYRFVPRPIAEQTVPHVVLADVDDETAFAFRALGAEYEGLVIVREARNRRYPWTNCTVRLDRHTFPLGLANERPLDVPVVGVADHILGSMRPVQREDVERRRLVRAGPDQDLGGYATLDDFAGASGLERAYEDHLRGTRGLTRTRLDTGATDVIDARPGDDLVLTIDVALQARIQALLSREAGLATVQPFHENQLLPLGFPLSAAVAVVDIETGELLALVSSPSRARVKRGDAPPGVTGAAWIDRSVNGVYPPGSIIKPLVLAAAVTDGECDPDGVIECTGHYLPDVRTMLRCWIYRERYGYRTHGAVDCETAIAHSCNIFFYTLGERLGLERLTAWCRGFGVGEPLHIGLSRRASLTRNDGTVVDYWAGESAGMLLDVDEIHAMSPHESTAIAIPMAIGQGAGVTWTCVQAANAFATLARGGVMRDATLIADPALRSPNRRPQGDLGLDPRGVARALEGLKGSVSTGGTGHALRFDGAVEPIFTAEGVTVRGKTGTAQAPPYFHRDTNGDTRIDSDDEGITGLDHAWFVGLAGPEDDPAPTVAIAVMVEYGGSGGRVAGPIANQVVVALQQEGYLPSPAVEMDPDALGARTEGAE